MEINNSILNTAKKMIQSYHLCAECFGRQFSLLGTGLTNSERAHSILNTLIMDYNKKLNESQGNDTIYKQLIEEIKSIALHTNYELAHVFLQKFESDTQEILVFSCELCNDFFASIDSVVQKVVEKSVSYEFSNFLVGTKIDAKIVDREDEFRARLNINSGESLKRNINRETGKKLEKCWGKSVEFHNPELSIQISFEFDRLSIELSANPLCIKGRYRKFIRGIPQTHWPHKPCHGRGCEKCNFTGKQYPTSVEEIINPDFLKNAKSQSSVFHGAGREDIDARCLGTGRPFIIELKEPKIRSLNLHVIEESIRKRDGDKVEVFDLQFVSRSEIKNLKSSGEMTRKTYNALIRSEVKLSRRTFKLKIPMVQQVSTSKPILQRTPLRVVHRRADLTRKRKIYAIEFTWVNKYHFKAKIQAMGGTYIKEFISGDEGRTKPSLAELFEVPLRCEELDIIDIGHV